ncbi:MAG: sodium:solute symporter [Bacteroidales bacterium]|nr:sodium:solute symporter [Candidatus Liminaster caballi]
MSSFLVLLIIALYFGVIFFVTWLTTRRAGSNDNQAFFTGSRQSPWWVVAIAMIGTSISGVTFISVPGMVAGTQFSYMQMVLGFVAGYFAIAYVLLPLYYRLNLSSIYGYLQQRFGTRAYRTGAIFFLLSKFLGCGVRMYLTALVLQLVLFDGLGIPFGLNVTVTMLVVWLYTFRGGVKTLVWTDMLQTLSLIAAVVLCIYYVCVAMHLDASGLWQTLTDSPMSRTWYFDDVNDKRYFWKQFLAGMFTTIAMTGLDQDMMQKNLSCRNLKDARKNVISYGFGFLPVNILFLALGILLYSYASSLGMFDASGLHTIDGSAMKPDELFPAIATGSMPDGTPFLPIAVGILFVLGLIAAAFSSAGSAITALTTSVTIDLLDAPSRQDEQQLRRTRMRVHIVNTIVMGVLIWLFRVIGSGSVINAVYVIASYTYGPLLGLYLSGLYTRVKARDSWIPYICVLSPLVCLVLSLNSEAWFGGYQIGFELLLINAAITMLGLWLSSLAPQSARR